jgi:PAS domain S-box-containing protein/putative nucleotidyltransferase with HDIG domain
VKNELRILHLEDNPVDAELVRETLASEGISCEIVRVETREDFLVAIEKRRFNLILADFTLPSFDGLSALVLAHERCPDVPFILVSGTMGEEVAIESLNGGATDYVIKEKLSRLAPAVRRALKEAEERIEHKRAEEALKQSEERFRMVFQRSPVGIFHYDRDLHITECNDRFVGILRSSREKLIGLDMKTLNDQNVLPSLREALEGKEGIYEGFYRATTSSAEIWISMRTIPILDGEGKTIGGAGIVEDMTERKRMDEAIKEQKKFAEDLIQNSAVAAFVLNPEHRTMLWNKACEELTGFSASDMIGTDNQWRPFYDHKRPVLADIIIDGTFGMLSDLYASHARSALIPHGLRAERWYTDPSGKDRYIIFDAAPIYDDKGNLAYVIQTLQDITDLKKAEEELRRSEASYKELTVILGESLEEIKQREQGLLKGREAFLNMLEDVSESYKDLSLAYEKTIEGWSGALDYRDKETEGHSQRVTDLTVKIAREMGMEEEDLVHIRRGALLHDIGKMGVPDNILLKPGKLTDEEWAVMKRHPEIAYELLSPIAFLRPALDIPYCHHEKWDGTGYPRGLRGKQIPFAARIFALVDVWDALRSDRPYRPAWSEERVFEHIHMSAGSHFDPEVVELFLKVLGISA